MARPPWEVGHLSCMSLNSAALNCSVTGSEVSLLMCSHSTAFYLLQGTARSKADAQIFTGAFGCAGM